MTIKLKPQPLKDLTQREQVNRLRHTAEVTLDNVSLSYDEWVKEMRPYGYSSMLCRAKRQILIRISQKLPYLSTEVQRQLEKLNV